MEIKDLMAGSDVRGHYLLSRKELIPFSSKPGRFLLMQLSDKTADIRAIVWEQGERLAAELNVGDVIEVEGRVTVFRDSLQIVCSQVHKSLPGQYSIDKFLPTSTRNIEEMTSELSNLIESIIDSDCRGLLEAVFTGDFLTEFAKAPAARSMHQAYVGGLVEHTLNVARLCDTVVQLYPRVDRDVLITGALLHDVGKVEEYALAAGIEITDEGRLLGHISMGYKLVSEIVESLPGFPPEKALRIYHMLLSHHGELAWGSPKEPQTVEACILHYTDNLDGQVSKYMEILAAGAPGQTWTNYAKRLGRALYMGGQEKTDFPENEL